MGFDLSNHRRKHAKIKPYLTFYEPQKSGTIAPLWFIYKLLIKRGIGRFVRAPHQQISWHSQDQQIDEYHDLN